MKRFFGKVQKSIIPHLTKKTPQIIPLPFFFPNYSPVTSIYTMNFINDFIKSGNIINACFFNFMFANLLHIFYYFICSNQIERTTYYNDKYLPESYISTNTQFCFNVNNRITTLISH